MPNKNFFATPSVSHDPSMSSSLTESRQSGTESWSESFDRLLSDASGRVVFTVRTSLLCYVFIKTVLSRLLALYQKFKKIKRKVKKQLIDNLNRQFWNSGILPSSFKVT